MAWNSTFLVLASLAAAVSPNLNRWVRFYLYSQVVSVALAEGALYLLHGDWQSPYYIAIYVVGSVACRLTSWWIVEEVGSHRLERVIALIFASAVTWTAYRHMNPVPGLEPRVLLPEGFLFVFLGTTLGFQSPFHKDRRILVPLSIMWLVLGVYDFGILMHRSEVWQRITDMGSYLIAITAFSWVAASRWLASPSTPNTR